MGPFNKYVTVKGEGGGQQDPWQTVTKILEGGRTGLASYIMENIEFLPLSRRNFKIFCVYSFQKVSKYPILIKNVILCTYIVIMII